MSAGSDCYLPDPVQFSDAIADLQRERDALQRENEVLREALSKILDYAFHLPDCGCRAHPCACGLTLVLDEIIVLR
jgi:hypothetical protein